MNQVMNWFPRVAALFMILFSIFLLGFPAGAASANGGPHGNYPSPKDGCSVCHRSPGRGQANRLKGNTIAGLCFSCHGSGAPGADTNVWDGRYEPTGAALNGGGFVNYRRVRTTSHHTYNGSPHLAWGSDTPARIALTCTACHDPHGSRNYRLLTDRVAASVVEYQDPTQPGHNQVVSNEEGGLNPDQPGYVPEYDRYLYRDGINSWCAGCHSLYLQTQSPSNEPYDAGDGRGAIIRYRHSILATTPSSVGLTTGLPLQQAAGYSATQQPEDKLGCITCHLAHGTNVNAVGWAAHVPPANDSALLRLDNRGVCEDCHKK